MILAGLWWFDGYISKDGTIGWERNAVRSSESRWSTDQKSRVAIIGSSTSRDWLSPRQLERILKAPRGTVIDAHINGCHQGCTAAQLRRLKTIRGDKPYERIFYGTNLFQLCEFTHSKRSLQQWLLRPVGPKEYLDLAWLYLGNAQDPLLHLGRFAGMALSDAYGDTIALRSTWVPRILGKPVRGKSHAWYRKRPYRKKATPLSCRYSEADIALKRAFTEALLDDTRDLASTTYLMLLPDRTISHADSDMMERWKRHRALHQSIADERPWVELIDLTDGLIKHSNQFRDGFHLKKSSMHLQRKHFERKLRRLLANEQQQKGEE